MDEIKETGGARIGRANATWPFATLTVNSDKLQLNASIIGSLVFKPSDVIGIVPYTVIPFLGQGIQIIHNVAGYNAKVIFWTMGSPAALIARIAQTGFLSQSRAIPPDLEAEIITAQTSGGFPMKVTSVIFIGVIWNLFFIGDFMDMVNGKTVHFGGINALFAVAFMFLTALLTLISEPFRNLILKPGRSVNDVKSFLFFIMFITGVMFAAFSLVFR